MLTSSTTTRGRLALSEWLSESPGHVAMEGTGVGWKPVRHILTAQALPSSGLRPDGASPGAYSSTPRVFTPMA